MTRAAMAAGVASTASFGRRRAAVVPGPAAGATPALSRPLLIRRCPATTLVAGAARTKDGVYEPSGYVRFAPHVASSAASVPSAYALCSHEIGDESTEHSQSGRQALAFTGRHHRYRSAGLVAVAGSGFSTLPLPCHIARPVVGGTRSAGAVSSALAVVASVRLALLAHHRLGAGIAPARLARLSRTLPVALMILLSDSSTLDVH